MTSICFEPIGWACTSVGAPLGAIKNKKVKIWKWFLKKKIYVKNEEIEEKSNYKSIVNCQKG